MSPSNSTELNDIDAISAAIRQIRLQHKLPDLAPKMERGHDDRTLDSETAMRETPAKQVGLVEPGWGLHGSAPSEAFDRRSVVAILDSFPSESESESEPTALIGKAPPYTLQDVGNSGDLSWETIFNSHRDCGAKENTATRTAENSSISTRVAKSTLPYKKLFPEAYADLRAEARKHEKDPPASAQKLQPPQRHYMDDKDLDWSTHSRHDSFMALYSEPSASTNRDIDEEERRERDTEQKDIRVSIDRRDVLFNAIDEAEESKESGGPDNDDEL